MKPVIDFLYGSRSANQIEYDLCQCDDNWVNGNSFFCSILVIGQKSNLRISSRK